MTEEQVLINHIQEYLDSGMWQYEACDLNKNDLKIIIKALKQKPILDKIKTEIESYIDKEKLAFGGQFDSALNLALKIIDKYKNKTENI